MINEKSLKTVNESLYKSVFRKPLYDSYCFSKIPATIEGLFEGDLKKGLPLDVFNLPSNFDPYNQVIVFLIDGFGFRFWEKYHEKYPFLKRFLDRGVVSKITSQFPSTTAAHISTLNTGMEVGQTGIYEWFYFEPNVDDIISPLTYNLAGDKGCCTLAQKGVTPNQLFPDKRFYADLKAKGIETHIFQSKKLETSPYSLWMLDGAHSHPFESFGAGLVNLSALLNTPSNSKRYFYVYFGEIDSVGHRTGIDSEEFEEAVHFTFECLEEFFCANHEALKKTACLLTADHGITVINPKTTVYLNKAYPEIFQYLQVNRSGKIKAPAGSSRDFFLYIQDQYLDKVKSDLERLLKGIAMIVPTEELIKDKIFGSLPVSQRFLDRVGNLVILPYDGESVWWYEKNRFEQHFFGMHGGLTTKEMDSLLLFQEL